MKYPSLYIVIPLMAGIIVRHNLHAAPTLTLLPLTVSMVVLVACAILFHRIRTPFASTTAIVMAFMLLGFTLYDIRYTHVATPQAVGLTRVSGVVCAVPQPKPKTTAVEIRTEGEVKFMVYLQGSKPPKMGDFIEVSPRQPTQPTVEGGGDGFDQKNNSATSLRAYRRYLFLQGISATCFADSASWQVVAGKGDVGLLMRLRQMQSQMVRTYADSLFTPAHCSPAEAALIEAMTTGYRINMPSQQRQVYARAGVSHMLALSGFHLTIIYCILHILLLSRFVFGWWRLIQRGLIVAVVWTFVAMTGMSASLVRAAIMFTVMAVSESLSIHVSDSGVGIEAEVGNFLDEMGQNRAINSLSFAALVMLLYDAFVLFDVGFQLSFVSMLAIIMCGPYATTLTQAIRLRRRPWHRAWRRGVELVLQKMAGVALVSAICSVATMPLVAYYFGFVSLLSVITNILVYIPAVLILVLAFLWWLFCFWSMAQDAIGLLLIKAAAWMNAVSQWVSQTDWGVLQWRPSVLTVILSYLLIAGIAWQLNRHAASTR